MERAVSQFSPVQFRSTILSRAPNLVFLSSEGGSDCAPLSMVASQWSDDPLEGLTSHLGRSLLVLSLRHDVVPGVKQEELA